MKKKVLSTLSQHIEHANIVLEKPKDRAFGHYATPIAFSLAKVYKKSPMLIASELANTLEASDIFDKVEAINGFINLRLSQKFLNEYSTYALQNESEFASDTQGENILLEYVSANPTGPLHIGHARGAVIGDALKRLGEHLGNSITTEYYVNDAGNQIHLLGLSLYLSAKENCLNETIEYPEEYYKGEYIVDLAKEAYAHFGAEVFASEESIERLSLWGKDRMLELIKSNLNDVGIEFERFVSERELYTQWDSIFATLQKRGALYEKEGKAWLESSKHGDEKDRVVVREDGRATYLAGDIIYHNQKFSQEFDHYINIWGADHHGYIQRVKASIEFLGYDSQKLEIILAQMVALLRGGEPYKMSKRAGNFILMSDVVEEIGKDALRFIFLSKKSDTSLEFDVDLLKQEDSSNPIYYINYAHARINQLFVKAQKSVSDVMGSDFSSLDDKGMDLLFSALLLPEVLEDAFAKREMQKITDYLKNLASLIHSYYNANKVVGEANEETLLKLFAVSALSLRVGLKMLGIKAKDRM